MRKRLKKKMARKEIVANVIGLWSDWDSDGFIKATKIAGQKIEKYRRLYCGDFRS